jgi:NADH-quinone oxidoreductase subunit M
MDFLRHYLLSILIILPALGAVAILFIRNRNAVRWAALSISAAVLLASLLLLICFDWHSGSSYAYFEDGGVVQLVERLNFPGGFNAQYLVGIDGLNFPMVLLTTFVFLLATAASWKLEKLPRTYFALFLLLESTFLGVFLSLDCFLLSFFLILSLPPIYLLIRNWGAKRRPGAALHFLLYHLAASILLLIAAIGIYLKTRQFIPGGSVDLIHLAGPELQLKFIAAMGGANSAMASGLFRLVLFSFLIRLPVWGLHVWLVDAAVEAPAAISMVVCGLTQCIGGYGILRIALPIFPGVAKSLWLLPAAWGVFTLIYGALAAMSQDDLKRLVAYSGMSLMGFVALGIGVMTTTSLNGALFMMVSQAVIGAALLYIAGLFEKRAGDSDLSQLDDPAEKRPLLGSFTAIALLAVMGLPGLSGFIGQIMILLGTFSAGNDGSILRNWAQHAGHHSNIIRQTRLLACFACLGMVLVGGYTLRTLQRLLQGSPAMESREISDLNHREIAILTPLIIWMILLGVLPWIFFFAFTNQTVWALVKLLGSS